MFLVQTKKFSERLN